MLILFRKFKRKELKTIWEVEKKGKKSLLAGTAHFFPYSLKTSLVRYIKDARTVIFEGPLDDENMSRVVREGFDRDNSCHLFDELDKRTVDKISRALAPACRRPNSFFAFLKILDKRSTLLSFTTIISKFAYVCFLMLSRHFSSFLAWLYKGIIMLIIIFKIPNKAPNNK